ncbi:heat-inducible transcriptional repressor HrcA [Effusibacillus lacus]|uniref:Heat-inducible transcription repressor HrcA n=1 Tax=Effusibacillus lacus TaxID=1348429 RepID=A0A292YP53_9BACL|nr:heat-inducible transcriptional repressor HrcA [Effusibacillus lacus]TCS68772.1 heat-inducible transcription repressor HrcA [Effusibacillus lacus]GAX90689.1 heat-inducible transcriptional repressor HrcA [Effusibacillus lacus]
MLSERQQLILRMIIEDYVHSAEPVGSRTISKRSEVTLSPATIRNEMADLEEMGYLEQPHTSAGRIPSQKGYRFYVDHLIHPLRLTQEELFQLKKTYVDKMDAMERVVQQTAQILSSLTNYTALVLGPHVQEVKLKHVQLVPLSDRTAVAIIVTDTGHVENRKVTLPEGITADEISNFVAILNHKMTDVPLHQVKVKLYNEIMGELNRYINQYEGVMSLLDQIVQIEQDDKVYLGGTTKILNQPEFRDIDKLRPLLDMLETNQTVLQLLNVQSSPGIQVRIGLENDMEQLKNCSVITATYQIDGKAAGTIGVLGPTRMEYGRVIGVMDHLTVLLSELLTRLHK